MLSMLHYRATRLISRGFCWYTSFPQMGLAGEEGKLAYRQELGAQLGQRHPEPLRQKMRSGCVTMNTECVGPQVQPGSVGRMQAMLQGKLSSACTYRVRVSDDAALLVPGQKSSLAVITAVYKDFLGHRKTEISRNVAL